MADEIPISAWKAAVEEWNKEGQVTYHGATHRSDLEAALFDEGLSEDRVKELMEIHDRIVEDEKDLAYRERSYANEEDDS